MGQERRDSAGLGSSGVLAGALSRFGQRMDGRVGRLPCSPHIAQGPPVQVVCVGEFGLLPSTVAPDSRTPGVRLPGNEVEGHDPL